jgi:hypothetical protein
MGLLSAIVIGVVVKLAADVVGKYWQCAIPSVAAGLRLIAAWFLGVARWLEKRGMLTLSGRRYTAVSLFPLCRPLQCFLAR